MIASLLELHHVPIWNASGKNESYKTTNSLSTFVSLAPHTVLGTK